MSFKISSYNRKLEDLRNEIQELQVLLEQARMGQHDPTTEKGNSLFSEVEDRRHLVERQMSKMKAKHDAMAIKFEAQKTKLRKVG